MVLLLVLTMLHHDQSHLLYNARKKVLLEDKMFSVPNVKDAVLVDRHLHRQITVGFHNIIC